ncbi:hypothetical protein PHJA_000697800 [Phtheirospermum japonicum]|uniref:C2 NT-type domain-containing protein n=1 Tax=Phtheirospermum japonicum TaxID=374723 RepID=A0A830BTW5_9LAMI|nr:hypothetical protein PHJA_000697800 [Phtheirospermum japonicum]
MFKLQRPTNSNRPSKHRPETLDFKFSNFQALQVPKGWDRLFLSIIHVETGKTIARLGKSQVRNGSCQWTETLSESISITRDDNSSKGYEEYLVKLIISAGSTKSTTLGELNINLANCATSRVAAGISQPLKKCSYGTILQLKLQCLTPRSKTGDEDSNILNSHEKDRNVHNHDSDNKSYRSDNSSDTTDGPPKEASQPDYHSFDNISSPNRRSISSSKPLLEASKDSIDELRAEAKMWERNARKLMGDLDLSRDEFSDLSNKQLELNIELSSAHAENEKLKLELENSTKSQCTQDFVAQSENLNQIQKVLENEMKYQQELNDNLGQQLKRSQESNIELVSVLQDLEQTIEQQRAEISAKEEEIASLEATLSGYVKTEHFEALDDDHEMESLRRKIEELEKDCAELTDENLELLLKLKDSNKNNNNIRKCASFDSSDESEVSDPKFQISADAEERKKIELEEENVRLRESISGLESQIRQLKDENEFSLRKTEDMQKKLLLAQEECENIKKENTAVLHASNLEASSEIRDLTGQLDSTRKNHEKLMAENEKVLKMLENYKRIEEKLKSELNELESKHKNEIGVLKAQLQNMLSLQDEISILKSELEGCVVDKGKLEIALETVSSDYEETKAENILLSEKISVLQDALSEFDECKRNKLVLEEKFLQMETDKKSVCVRNEELKSELSEIKRENMQFRNKMHGLEEEVKLLKERDNIHKEGAKNRRLLENESNKNRAVHESRTSDGQKNNVASTKKLSSEVVARERYERTKSSLETELKDLRERYLEMSLKYAEVESEREDLVMKLKVSKGVKRWFS